MANAADATAADQGGMIFMICKPNKSGTFDVASVGIDYNTKEKYDDLTEGDAVVILSPDAYNTIEYLVYGETDKTEGE